MPSPKLRARKDDDRDCELVSGRNGDTRNDVRLWTLGKMGQVLRRLRDIKKKKGPTTPSDTDNDLDDIDMEAVRYKPPGLEQLCCSTKFTRNELRIMYRGFKQECPTGIVNEETFKEIYAQFFPHGDSSAYAHYVFSTFDQDHDGAVSFEDFVTGLSVLARGTFQEKIQWAFGLYDINGDGVITRDEMLDIIVAIYDLLGKMVEPSLDDATAKEHVHRIFDTMDSNKDGVITIEEFIEACRKDQHISKSMNIFDTVL